MNYLVGNKNYLLTYLHFFLCILFWHICVDFTNGNFIFHNDEPKIHFRYRGKKKEERKRKTRSVHFDETSGGQQRQISIIGKTPGLYYCIMYILFGTYGQRWSRINVQYVLFVYHLKRKALKNQKRYFLQRYRFLKSKIVQENFFEQCLIKN